MSAPCRRTLRIVNRKGLHARASAKFVSTVEAHDASARVSHDGIEVSGDSIMGLLTLAAAQGSEIEVEASGPEAEALLDALEALVADYFGEGG
ncbi:HPr family phosphocarrier protein [Oceanicella actignis]|uniref:Phosphocarrier protein n=1 Tax=Oceanicella actignis TaxID=1189325 RepID=A0A1M7TJ81_9RHOB|nr:HPr family phosphocarrier protein [Oceanicella actignis]TYO88142.1 phosphocarrier protein [Oceanicella actignis]SET65864.1 phosphocarrier protein [Oceanicella actignis]SHN70746.1 phosphocarrier protein [Oceanicella actignis]